MLPLVTACTLIHVFMLTCFDDTVAVGLRGCALLLQPLQTAA